MAAQDILLRRDGLRFRSIPRRPFFSRFSNISMTAGVQAASDVVRILIQRTPAGARCFSWQYGRGLLRISVSNNDYGQRRAPTARWPQRDAAVPSTELSAMRAVPRQRPTRMRGCPIRYRRPLSRNARNNAAATAGMGRSRGWLNFVGGMLRHDAGAHPGDCGGGCKTVRRRRDPYA
jgi:hypothetical protein